MGAAATERKQHPAGAAPSGASGWAAPGGATAESPRSRRAGRLQPQRNPAAPGGDSSAARCSAILSPRRHQNFCISFAAAAVLPCEPGAAGCGRGAVRGVVRGRFPREIPRVSGCCRPLRHAAGRCGADAPLLMPSGAGRGRVLTRSLLCSPPLALQPLYSAHHSPAPSSASPRYCPLLQGSLSPQRSFQDDKSCRSVRGILAKLCLLYYLCPSMVSDPSSPGLNVSFIIGKREVVSEMGVEIKENEMSKSCSVFLFFFF